MTATRRLAAIVVADVVGYSRLMEADEAGTLAAMKERRKAILEPVVTEHGGRIVKVMGDGVLIEFASAVKAVEAALALQEKFRFANDEVSEERRVRLRIGINLGDVIGEGSDIYGDGVNIAARLEALAEPDGLCISAKVHEEVRGKVEAEFEDLGEQRLKNMVAPVRTYAWRSGAALLAPLAASTDKPSIAVLPFTNMSGDPEQQYFSDGITEDIITELSRFRSLLVIARNSSFQYRDKAADVRRIGAELGARYVVEGSVRKMGRIRITAQLIDAAQGSHLWSERFDRSLEELFDVQDEVTHTIVATISGRIEETEMKGAASRKTVSLPAYDCLLRGIEHLRDSGANDNRQARELFERAVGLDSGFALAHAYHALSLLVEAGYASAPRAVKERAIDIALTAVRLDPRENRCHLFLGHAYRFADKFDLAVSHMEEAIRLNPNDAHAMGQFAGLLGVVGRPTEGVEMLNRARSLNPYLWSWYHGVLAQCLFAARRYEEALAANAKIGKGKKPWQFARDAACLAQLGRLDEAGAVAAEVLRLKPNFRVSTEIPSYKHEADTRHLRDALLKAGLPE